MGVCEISALSTSPNLLPDHECAAVLPAVNVVRPVGRSTLTAAPGRRAAARRKKALKPLPAAKPGVILTRPDPMGENAGCVKTVSA
jgi:hypothetical protein